MTETKTNTSLLTPYQQAASFAFHMVQTVPGVREFYKAPHALRGTPARKRYHAGNRPGGRLNATQRELEAKRRMHVNV